MIFTKEYSKLSYDTFTTIRKNTGYYVVTKVVDIETPEQKFEAIVVRAKPIRKEDITDKLAKLDADCLRGELIKKLEDWYGKNLNDFILLTLAKVKKR